MPTMVDWARQTSNLQAPRWPTRQCTSPQGTGPGVGQQTCFQVPRIQVRAVIGRVGLVPGSPTELSGGSQQNTQTAAECSRGRSLRADYRPVGTGLADGLQQLKWSNETRASVLMLSLGKAELLNWSNGGWQPWMGSVVCLYFPPARPMVDFTVGGTQRCPVFSAPSMPQGVAGALRELSSQENAWS